MPPLTAVLEVFLLSTIVGKQGRLQVNHITLAVLKAADIVAYKQLCHVTHTQLCAKRPRNLSIIYKATYLLLTNQTLKE